MGKIARMLAVLAAMVALGAPALAEEAAPSAALAARAEALAAFLAEEEGDVEAMFAPSFLAAVPRGQVMAISGQLRGQHGAVVGLAGIEPRSAEAGVVAIAYERAEVRMQMVIENAPPHRITGLLIDDVRAQGGDPAAVLDEIRALPGLTGFAVARLGDNGPALAEAHEADRPMAVGSAFKLFILAELARAVNAGERTWADVVPLDRRSLPSGFLAQWPQGSPMTLHSLAGLMISQSDNTATDTLLHLLGRERVEAIQSAIGIADPARNRPFLSTLEAFALKAGGEDMHAQWRDGDEAARRALLDGPVAAIGAGDIDPLVLSGTPHRIDTVEWFASAADLVRVMDWLRRQGGETARAILAINPGLGRGTADGFAFAGFKGGSEPGVLNLTYLLQDRDGAWHVVAANWNDPANALDEARFVGLVGRAVQALR